MLKGKKHKKQKTAPFSGSFSERKDADVERSTYRGSPFNVRIFWAEIRSQKWTRENFKFFSDFGSAFSRSYLLLEGISKVMRKPKGVSTKLPPSRLPIPSSKFQAPSSKLQVPSSKLQAPSSKLQAPSSKFQVPNSNFQAPSSTLQAPRSALQAPNSKQQTTNIERQQ